MFQLEGNEKRLELENVVMDWLGTSQVTVLLARGQTLEETLASSLLVHLVTPSYTENWGPGLLQASKQMVFKVCILITVKYSTTFKWLHFTW